MTDAAEPIDTVTGHGADDEVPTRQCGRCRGRFSIPADSNAMELRDWWACSDCSESLMPGRKQAPPT